jgi:hypothetical protein
MTNTAAPKPRKAPADDNQPAEGPRSSGVGQQTAPPQFSVVIPTYNRGAAILPTIDAVRKQLHDSFEIVVVDDGSTDGTRDRVDGIGDPRLRVISRSNGGISAARNTGAQHALGRYLVMLDDDDIPQADWLRRFDAAIGETDASFISCGYREVDSHTASVRSTTLPINRGPVFDDQVATLLAGTFATRRDHFFEVGGFTEGLQSSHQTEFGLRMLPACVERGWGVASIDAPLVDIHRRASTERAEQSPEKLLLGAEYILHEHHDRLSRSPRTAADFRSVAGVAAYRLGSRERARLHFKRAWQLQPMGWRFAARYLLSCVPAVATRVWGADGSGRSGSADRSAV